MDHAESARKYATGIWKAEAKIYSSLRNPLWEININLVSKLSNYGKV
jgi:hypothetical protein